MEPSSLKDHNVFLFNTQSTQSTEVKALHHANYCVFRIEIEKGEKGTVSLYYGPQQQYLCSYFFFF